MERVTESRSQIAKTLSILDTRLKNVQQRYSMRRSWESFSNAAGLARSYVGEIGYHVRRITEIGESIKDEDSEIFDTWKRKEQESHRTELMRCVSDYWLLQYSLDNQGVDIPEMPLPLLEKLKFYSLQ